MLIRVIIQECMGAVMNTFTNGFVITQTQVFMPRLVVSTIKIWWSCTVMTTSLLLSPLVDWGDNRSIHPLQLKL